MKKMFFSAVALVAFSFAGMANTGEGKIEVKEFENEKELKTHPCTDFAIMMLEFYESANDCTYTDEDAQDVLNNWYAFCFYTMN